MADEKNEINSMENSKKPDPNYWKSFEQLAGDSSITELSRNEFKPGATDEFNVNKLSGLSRRKFLALVGASAALASTGCSNYRDEGEIIPYINKPEEITVGKPNYYSSTAYDGSGILVKTREGRPIKVIGNPDHPINKGKVSAQCQAEILELYNPERLQNPLRKGSSGLMKSTWGHVDADIINALSKSGDKQIAIVTKKIVSPTQKKLLEEFSKKYSNVKIYSYELFTDETRKSAWQKSYGSENYPSIKWNEAKIILSLEGDFLGNDGNTVESSRLFTEGRNIDDAKNFNRLYVVEGNMSLTGMNADYRLRLRPDAQFEFVMSLLNEFGNSYGNYNLKSFAKKYSLSEKTLKHLVDDLKNNSSSSIVYTGNMMPENVHIAVNMLNDTLGAKNLYDFSSIPILMTPYSSKGDWEDLINKMDIGQVSAIIHFDSNPVFHLANDFGYEKALKNVEYKISLTGSENETSEYCDYVLPIHHTFESWGDFRTRNNFYSLQQPVIAPIFNTRQKEAVLLHWMNGSKEGFNEDIYHKYLMDNWEKEIYPGLHSELNFKELWYGSLHDGIVLADGGNLNIGKINSSALSSTNYKEPKGYTLVLKESYSIGDGRFIDNGWLQEVPHPVTKVTWDNYAAISKNTADTFGLKLNDLIEITVGNKKLEIPVHIQAGSADDTITIELGYGRRKSGTVGAGVGFDAIKLMSKDYELSPWLYSDITVKKISGSHKLVLAQEYYYFDDKLTHDVAEKRNIVREGTVAEFIKNPEFLFEGKEEEHEPTLYPNYEYKDVKWGMVVDQNKCTGCSECIVACISENNIPVVGKDQVAVGREMHWLRVDRYYSGSIDEPKVHTELMLCQHCDHAPCENVCPVLATTHSPDGLNQMVYNRCVGTRYCSNNCPYKVRRFNFFNFRDHFNDKYQESTLFDLVYNPEVTVRSRGVMEKCTFCIQRIEDEREDAIREKRAVKGSNVVTACQESCSTNAIRFGNIIDKEEEVAKYRMHELGYGVLEELNVRPNVTYLAKLRNTHTEDV